MPTHIIQEHLHDNHFHIEDDEITTKPHHKTAMPYWGLLSELERGWQLCDGTNGTPDLSGFLILGTNNPSEVLDETTLVVKTDGGGMNTDTLDFIKFYWITYTSALAPNW